MNIKNSSFTKILNNKVVKAGSWYTVTNFFTKGIVFLTLPIFTRLLSTSDYGIANLYATYVSIFAIVLPLDLYASVTRAKFDFNEDYNNYLSSVLFLSIISFAAFSSVILIFRNFFSNILGLESILLSFLLIHSFASYVHNFVFAKFRVEYNYKKISILQIITSIGGVILAIILITQIFTNKRYYGQIIGKALPTIVLGFILMFYVFIKGKKKINIEYWKYALALSVPIIFHNLAGIINAQFDRILINTYIGSSETGIYSFAYNIGMIITVLNGSFNQAWVPWFYEKNQNLEYENIRRRAKNYRDVFSLIYIAILFLSPEIIKVMSEKSYWEGLSIVPFIFMGYYLNFMYVFEVNVEFYEKKTRLIATGTILSMAINVVLNIIYIPKYGYVAAAITTVISYFFLFVFHYIITHYILRIKLFELKFHLISLLYVGLSTIAFIILQDYLILRIGILILVGIYLYQKYKKVFLNM